MSRDYQVHTTADFRPAIFLQGACEGSHGLSDTLLSVTSVRTGEIGDALLAAQAQNPMLRAQNSWRCRTERSHRA